MNLTTKYMTKQIFMLSWPVVLEGIAIMMLGFGTTAMVGKYGAVTLAAVSLATIIQAAMSIVFAAVGTGAAALVARNVGADEWSNVRAITGQAILLGIILGIILGVGGYYLAPLLFIFTDADKDVIRLSTDLIQIIFIFVPFHLVMNVINNILRVMGKTKIVFYMNTINNILALLLSYALINGIGFAKLEAYGAAWGIAFSFVFGSLLALITVFRQKDVALNISDVFCIRKDNLKKILNISIPAGLEQLALQSGRIAFTFMLAGVSVTQFAGHQVAMQIEGLSFMPGYAFCIAAMAFTGQNLGKGLPHRAERYVNLTNKIGIISMGILGIIFLVFAEQLAKIFVNDPEVLEWAILCIQIGAFEQATLAITYVYSGALRGAGDTKWPLYITALGVWGIRVPLIYIFIVLLKYDIHYAWIITVLDYFVRSVIFWLRFRKGLWRKINFDNI